MKIIHLLMCYLTKHEVVETFAEQIADEEYDTDAIMEDISDHNQGSNIINTINDNKIANLIIDYVKDVKSMYIILI